MTDMSAFVCLDCRENTAEIEEYYMVKHDVWLASGLGPHGGMLCIGCLEERLGRTLTPEDFLDCLLNNENFGKSARLLSRLI